MTDYLLESVECYGSHVANIHDAMRRQRYGFKVGGGVEEKVNNVIFLSRVWSQLEFPPTRQG
jgi:hypothetical protein